jgi:orotidine-5'-phosphate decarboxylase
MFNIHASAGIEGIKAAAEASSGLPTKLLGVTVLTSHDDEECISIFGADRAEKVKQFAEWMAAFGGHGLVCSAYEAADIKADRLTNRLLTVVPGIRLPGDAVGDQAKVMTPGRALKAGADLLVIGRSLTNPKTGTRLDALVRTEENIDETLASR